jgi:transcriptional regulator with XRE-family HTH domain
MNHIGEQIRLARILKGWKQDELGKNCKPPITQQLVSFVERNETNPNKKIVKKIANGLKMTIEEIQKCNCIPNNQLQAVNKDVNTIMENTSNSEECTFQEEQGCTHLIIALERTKKTIEVLQSDLTQIHQSIVNITEVLSNNI